MMFFFILRDILARAEAVVGVQTPLTLTFPAEQVQTPLARVPAGGTQSELGRQVFPSYWDGSPSAWSLSIHSDSASHSRGTVRRGRCTEW